MKNTTLAVLIIVAAVGGYLVGQSNANMGDTATQASIEMMKKQSESIKQMSELMQSSGMMMQEMSGKYGDEIMMSKGKDMEMIGRKYMDENTSASGSGAMKQMMGN